MSLSQFEVIGKLGEGAFAQVFKVRRKSDKEIYAMKKVKFGPMSSKEKENALNEVRLLASFEHQNIIAYKEAFFDEGTCLCIITEFAEGGDLLAKIENHKKMRTKFLEVDIWDYLIQICQGLASLHSNRILHRDIKSANIFLSKGIIKIGDLNVSKVNKHGLAVTQTGTPYYACPEVWRDKPYNSSSDIWSVGCVIYEMAAQRPPFMANDMKGLYDKVIKGIYPPIPPGYSHDLSNIISQMLQVNPVARPSCQKILEQDMVRRHMRGIGVELSKNDLLSTIKYVPSLKELSSRLPAPNYEGARRSRGKSINHTHEDSERAESLGRQRQVSVENRRADFRPQQKLPPGLPRYGYKQEYSDAHRYGGNELSADRNEQQKYQIDISLDRKLNRQNSYGDERKANRPLLNAGANVMSGESGTPKLLPRGVVIERVLSEAALDNPPRYRK
ncbi:hypothetical protein SteCoe_24345 [Stentor coeruleus]|uniref:non-specific serine/threonine protein kinase n=1 Tax=Stentor coeruleus TaxID=5963 RepID=A0A1R2BHV5_9CILI|nr:hypothetical protein SteCoe_24345 [Stentor coeruleus]